MLTVGKLINALKNFDDDTLIDLGCTEELYQDLLDTYDGIGFYLAPKLKIFHCSDNDKEKVNLVIDYFVYDEMTDEELEEIEGSLDEIYELKKEVDIKQRQDMNDEIGNLVDNITEILKEHFYEKGDLCLGNINQEQDYMTRITWFKPLNIVKSCDYIFEENYDDIVDVCTNFNKAETIDEAWDYAESIIYDYLNNWIIDMDYWNDFGEDTQKYIDEFKMLQDFPY